MTDFAPFQDVEEISLKCATHSADIRLANIDEGWAWSASCARRTGDVAGWGEPLGRMDGRVRTDRLASSRAEAISAAVAVIRSCLSDKPITDWLDTLPPKAGAQPDLFSEAA